MQYIEKKNLEDFICLDYVKIANCNLITVIII